MKILIVSQYFHPENFRINDLARALVERGHRVTVLTGLPNYPSGRLPPGYGFLHPLRQVWEGVNVVRVPLVTRGAGRGVRLMLNYLSFALMGAVLGPLRLGRDFDVIFVHEPSPITVCIPAIVMKWASGAPILLWVLDLWPESVAAASGLRSPRVLGALAALVRWIYRHCDRILVQSRGFIPHTRAMGVSEERILYFPSWAEAVYGSGAPHAHMELAKLPVELRTGFRILFAGNVGVAQDFPTILAAAESLKERKDVHWVIVGDGRMLDWVRAEVARRGLVETVHLLGRYPVEAMPAFFDAADVLLVTLRRDPIFSLTIPGKIQSYLAFGKPVLAALDGEGARIVDEANAGLTCPAETPGALARMALRLAEMPAAQRRAMAENGRRYYDENFDRDRLFAHLDAWMRELAAPSRAAGKY